MGQFTCMGAGYSEFFLRRPRHPVVGQDTLRVEIARSLGASPAVLHVTLVDVSRSGFRFQAGAPLVDQEPIRLHLHDENSGLDLHLPGSVRWQREEANGTWSIGCLTPEPLSWETLGELFLNGILSTDDPSPGTRSGTSC